MEVLSLPGLGLGILYFSGLGFYLGGVSILARGIGPDALLVLSVDVPGADALVGVET